MSEGEKEQEKSGEEVPTMEAWVSFKKERRWEGDKFARVILSFHLLLKTDIGLAAANWRGKYEHIRTFGEINLIT